MPMGSITRSQAPPPTPTPTPHPRQQQRPRPLPLRLDQKQLLRPVDVGREQAWLRRKGSFNARRRSKSVSDDDLNELRGCIDLGFGFGPESPVLDPKLSDTLPALGFYCRINRQYSSGCLTRSSSSSSIGGDSYDAGSGRTIFGQDDDPETVKERLRQWAQVVAFSVRQFSGERMVDTCN